MKKWFCKPYSPVGGNGFTVIELLIAVAIVSILAGVGVQIFLTVANSFGKATVISGLQQEGSRVVNDLSRVIRDASLVELAASGDCPVPVNGIKLTVSEDSLEYQSNGNCGVVVFCWVPKDATPTYNNYLEKKLSGSSCTTTIGAGPLTNRDINSGVDVSQLGFTITGGSGQPYLVSIDLTLAQALKAPQKAAYQAGVSLKNSVATRNF